MLLIYGKGIVGNGLQALCKALGITSQLVDDKDEGGIDRSIAEQANWISVSPGVPPTHEVYIRYPDKCYSELNRIGLIMKDYPRRQSSIKIGITGTKGKSTTTWMTYKLLAALLPTYTVHITGNFKVSLGQTLADIMTSFQTDRQHMFVIEASSFMLYHLQNVRFDYSIWTNFSPDHLNWHRDLADYFDSKASIIRQTREVCLTNEDIITQRNSIDGETDCLLEVYQAYENIGQTRFIGAHNALNLGSSIQLAHHLLDKIEQTPSEEQWTQAINTIPALEHRLQPVKTIHGITIYDDNNSTNSTSLQTALESFDHAVILICGGSDKGDSFDHLQDLFTRQVAHACLIGYMSPVFAKLCEQADVSYTLCEDLPKAVTKSYDLAKQKKSDTILFSPGCASFDQYLNYHERATHFITLVDKLI